MNFNLSAKREEKRVENSIEFRITALCQQINLCFGQKQAIATNLLESKTTCFSTHFNTFQKGTQIAHMEVCCAQLRQQDVSRKHASHRSSLELVLNTNTSLKTKCNKNNTKSKTLEDIQSSLLRLPIYLYNYTQTEKPR